MVDLWGHVKLADFPKKGVVAGLRLRFWPDVSRG